MSRRYLPLNDYDGSLIGLQSNPAGPYDVPSPGGLASMQHHWSHGLFGPPERVVDVYAGTGDRYIHGEYGNMYVPNSHANVYNNYRGPHSDRTENSTIRDDPYYWNEKKSSPTKAKGVENFESSTVELIEDVSQQSKQQTRPVASKPPPIQKNTTKNIPISDFNKFTELASLTDPSLISISEPKGSSKSSSRTIIAILIIFILICGKLWEEALHNFIKQRLGGGKEISWVRYGIYATLATILLITIIHFADINFSN